jgi:ABC-type bacteriocin/lantibiotic exporter with double-glycine peptidase domain
MQNKQLLFSMLMLFLLLSQVAFVQGEYLARLLGKVPYHHNEEVNWCGPAALQMVLDYWGFKINQSTIALEIFRENTTTIDDMVRYTYQLGFQNPPVVGSISQIKDAINRGLPAIVLQKTEIGDPIGHYRVVVGYSDIEKAFITYDPGDFGKDYHIGYSEFADLWSGGSTFNTENWTLILDPSAPTETTT